MSSADIEKWRVQREAARRRQIWTILEILDQIDVTRKTAGATGNVHFSMKALMRDRGSLDTALKDGPYKNQALVPVSPWLDDQAPDKPALKIKHKGETITASWRPAWKLFGGEKPWLWAVYVKRGDAWDFHVYPAQTRSIEFSNEDSAERVRAIAVAQVDRCGNESKRNVQPVGATP